MAKQSPHTATTATKPGLQVIGAGLPRTSTASLQSALEILGFAPCYHMITGLLPNHRKHSPLWLAAMRERDPAVCQKLLAQATHGYTAIVDAPGCLFVADWVEMYPDAMVVLGQRRNARVWLDSFNATVGRVFGRGPLYWAGYFVPELRMAFMLSNLWEENTREKFGVGVHTGEYYRLHNEWVRSVVPQEKLLEFQASDGWELLARFLGKEKPDRKFPRMNDSKATNGLIMSFVINGVGVWVGILVAMVLLVKSLMMYLGD